jgi:hypothetical protein
VSRSGYYDDYESDSNIGFLWDSITRTAIRGRRGQRLLREMGTALDAMPVKELEAGVLVEDGQVCALGAVALARGIDVSALDPEDPAAVAKVFDIPTTLAREVAYQNDDGSLRDEAPAERWTRMRAWVNANVLPVELEPDRAADQPPPEGPEAKS